MPRTAGKFLPRWKNGIIDRFDSGIAAAQGVEQPKEHHWDVFEHSVKTVSAVDFILHEGVWEYQNPNILALVPWTEATAEYFDRPVSSGSTGRSLLKLARCCMISPSRRPGLSMKTAGYVFWGIRKPEQSWWKVFWKGSGSARKKYAWSR